MSVVVPANEEGRKFYEQAEVKPAKWLMPDGSIVDEFPMAGGGSASLDNNVEKTIDVSTYTEPVEIEPTEGKDGMKKATVTLSNIPSGADLEANKEATINVSTYTEPVEITPTEGKDGMAKATVTLSNIPSSGGSWHDINDETILRVGEVIRARGSIVAFRMKVSSSDIYVTGSIMGGDGDGGTTVSACGMKIVDYWEQPSNCFFNTGFDIGYNDELSWGNIATSILNAYNDSTGGSDTLTSFAIYY